MADEMKPGNAAGVPEGAKEEVSWEAAFNEVASVGGAKAMGKPASGAGLSLEKSASGVEGAGREGPLDINFLLDIPLNVTVEIGRTRMVVNDLLQLGQGSVIPLDKLVGEPFEVLVNQKLMARGEIVVVNEKFGVRLTDVIDPKERIQQLG
ncbi:flagellar motor switch protein FliN [Candidatus Sumerlaeota bacterium]|nr:flagellar motor switch protein FliN [Candidatus Sumerlaeota bacterium]